MDKTSRTFIIIALIAAVIGLGLGFAAFTRTLTIQGNVTVTPEDTFNVAFDTVAANSYCTVLDGSDTGVTYNKGNVADTAITNVSIGLVKPGDAVLCTYRVNNNSSYLAYLNKLNFAGLVTCSIPSGSTATQSLVTDACAGVKATIQVGGTAFGTGGVSITDTTLAIGSNNAIDNHTLLSGDFEYAFLKVWYEDGSSIADGEFVATIPTITLQYDTTDAVN